MKFVIKLFYQISLFYIAGFLILLGIFTITDYLKQFDEIQKRLRQLCRQRGIKLIFLGLIEMSVIIGFIFGIHAEILSGYDKNKSDSHQNYDWYYSRDIVRFPVDQIRLKGDPGIEDIEFDFAGANDFVQHNRVNYLIVVDKTLSANLPASFHTESVNIKEGFYSYLNKGRAKYSNLTDNKARRLNDLVVLSMLKRIHEMKAFMPARSMTLSVMSYLGGDSLTCLGSKSSADSVNTLTTGGIIDIVDNMDTLLANSNPTVDSGTDLIGWFTTINKTISDNSFGDNSTIIIFISDFVHEGDISALEFDLKNFRKNILSKTHQLCLVQYPFKKKKTPLLQQKALESSHAVMNLFKSNFDNIYVYPVSTDRYLKDRDGVYTFLNCLNYTSNVENTRANYLPYAYFYKPALSNTSMNSSLCSFMIRDTGLYSFALRSSSGNGYKGTYLKTDSGSDYLFVDEPVLFRISDAPKRLCFSAFNIQDGTDYFIEVSRISADEFFRFRIPIVFREVLPITSSYLLLVTYLFWFLLFSYFLILFGERYMRICLGSRNPLPFLYGIYLLAVIYIYAVSVWVLFRREFMVLGAVYLFISILSTVYFSKYLICHKT